LAQLPTAAGHLRFCSRLSTVRFRPYSTTTTYAYLSELRPAY
jgi:hypothetical protein